MPFIGTTPTQGFVSSFPKQSFTPNGSTTVFTLTNPVATANDLEVFVGNVRQEPTTAYTAAGTTLTMSEAPASGLNFYVINKSFAQVTTNPPDGSVSTAKIVDANVTTAKLASGSIANAKLADDVITTAKLNASLITHIDAGSTKAQGVTTSFADTNLSGNITIPAGCTNIIWHMRGGYRQNGISTSHASYRLKFVRSSDNLTTYIGHGSWGFGIFQGVGATGGYNHSIITLYANLFDYDSDNNQANLVAGNTYTFTVQVKSASGANGSNLYTFGDTTNNHTYYPAFMTFMFF